MLILPRRKFIDEKKKSSWLVIQNEVSHWYRTQGLSSRQISVIQDTSSLSTELTEAKNAYQLAKLEKKIQKVDLLILNEMSYVSFDRHQSELLFKVIADRSERGSTIVTTDLPFSNWTKLFKNVSLVSALVDRLTFRSYALDMNKESYRLEHPKTTVK